LERFKGKVKIESFAFLCDRFGLGVIVCNFNKIARVSPEAAGFHVN
jgi:hypothetical protein